MALSERPAYRTARERLHTQPTYLIRFATPGAVGSAKEYPFSRDFAGPVAPRNPTRNPYLLLGTPSGNTQTVDLRTGASSRGNLTFPLLDKGGIVTAYLSDPALPLAAPLTAGDSTAVTVVGDTGGYPDEGTLELVAADGTTERIRYARRERTQFSRLTRAVDDTTARAWPAGTAVHNGEQIRPGTRVHLLAGYGDLDEADMVRLGRFEVLERVLDQDRVTWLLRCADVQYRANVQVFLTASEQSPLTLGPAHPARLALQVLTSTGAGTNGAYDVLARDLGAGVDVALVDVAAFEALERDIPGVQFQFSLTGPSDAAAFVAQQLLWPLGAVLWASPDGLLSARRILREPSADAAVVSLDTSSIVSWGPWAAGDRDVVNVVDVRYDWKPTALPGGGSQTRHDYQTRQQIEATRSIQVYGRRPVNGMGRPHTWAGLRSELGAQALIDRHVSLVFARWADPAPLVPVTVFYKHHNLDLGDFVTVTHPHWPDLGAGLRGVDGSLWQVLDLRPGFGAAGGVTLVLSAVAPSTRRSGDAFGRTVTTAPRTALAAPQNFQAVQSDLGVSLTWAPVDGAVGYEIREGSTWVGAKLVAARVDATFLRLPDVLDGTHIYRIRAIAPDGTRGPEATATTVQAGTVSRRDVLVTQTNLAAWTRTNLVYFAPIAIANLNGIRLNELPGVRLTDPEFTGKRLRMGAPWDAQELVLESPVLDKGSAGTSAIFWAVALTGEAFRANLKSFPGRRLNTFRGDRLTAVTQDFTTELELALSQDGATFGAWQPFRDGDYTFRAFKVRARIRPASIFQRVRVS